MGYPHLWPLDKIIYEDKDGVEHVSIITDHTIKSVSYTHLKTE